MVRGKGKKVLTPAERSDIMGQKQEAEATLKELEQGYGTGTPAAGIDKSRIQAEIKHLDKVLDEGRAPNVRGASKDRLAKEAAELAAKMKDGLPTREEMDHPAKNPGAIHKHMMWLERNKQNTKRFKEIMRTLEPHDPTAGNVERLRRQ